MTNDERMTKLEFQSIRAATPVFGFRGSEFGFLSDFGIRISDFICHSFPRGGIIRHFRALFT
jgi:hypothetical protein